MNISETQTIKTSNFNFLIPKESGIENADILCNKIAFTSEIQIRTYVLGDNQFYSITFFDDNECVVRRVLDHMFKTKIAFDFVIQTVVNDKIVHVTKIKIQLANYAHSGFAYDGTENPSFVNAEFMCCEEPIVSF